MVTTVAVTALCGVTEPAFYGCLIERPRLLVGTAIGALCAGLPAGIFVLKEYVAGACPGLLSALIFIAPDGSMGNFVLACVVAIIAIVVSIVVALALIGVLVWALTSKGGGRQDGKGTETSQTTNGGSNNKNKDGYIEVPRGDSNGNSDDDSYDSINKDYQQKKQELDKKKQELQQELDNYKKKYGGSSSYDNQNSYDSYGDSYDSYGDSYDSTGY